MEHEWIDEYCRSKTGVERDYKVEWQATRYMIRGKIFAMIGGDKNGRPIITVKLAPATGAQLREEYPDIIPGYHMNKVHWNSLYLESDVPERVLKGMLDQAHSIVLNGLSKKAREAIIHSEN